MMVMAPRCFEERVTIHKHSLDLKRIWIFFHTEAPYKKKDQEQYYGDDISRQMNLIFKQEKPKDMQHQPKTF